VLAAAGDTAADASAIAAGRLAVHLRDRHDKAQAPTCVAGLNASLLLIVAIYVGVEAVHRLTTGSPPVHHLPTLIASGVAMLVTLQCAAILGRSAADEDLHMRAVLWTHWLMRWRRRVSRSSAPSFLSPAGCPGSIRWWRSSSAPSSWSDRSDSSVSSSPRYGTVNPSTSTTTSFDFS